MDIDQFLRWAKGFPMVHTSDVEKKLRELHAPPSTIHHFQECRLAYWMYEDLRQEINRVK